jgi:LmbE family N-acetylglucosaminyl deacetylase
MRGLLAVLAHPDDESMGTGGLLLRHTRVGLDVNAICATRGEAGWVGKPEGAAPEDLATIRAAELEAAAAALGLTGIELWTYPDGALDRADSTALTQLIWEEIVKLRPAAVVGWGPDGGYGHPDHIAIGSYTDAAVAAVPEGERPALYHIAADEQLAAFYRLVVRDGDGLPVVVADHVDFVVELTPEEVMMKMRAIDCHQSQLEEWRVEIRNHPELLKKGYGHEPYVAVSSRAPGLTSSGLLGEFA